VAPLEVQPGDHYIAKKRWSAFFQTHLDLLLRRLGVVNVVLAGVQTPNCIRGTAYDAIALDYPNVRGPMPFTHAALVKTANSANSGTQRSSYPTDARDGCAQVVVLSDATASKSQQVQENNLQDMRDAQVTVLPTAEWAELLLAAAT
jgi:nicotinamidase-related amidase